MDKQKKVQDLVNLIREGRESIEVWKEKIRRTNVTIQQATGQGKLLDVLIKEDTVAKKQEEQIEKYAKDIKKEQVEPPKTRTLGDKE